VTCPRDICDCGVENKYTAGDGDSATHSIPSQIFPDSIGQRLVMPKFCRLASGDGFANTFSN